MAVTYYTTVDADAIRPYMQVVPTLLSAASFARYRHSPYGWFRVPRLPTGFPPVAVDCGGFVAARRGGFDYVALQYVQCLPPGAWRATKPSRNGAIHTAYAEEAVD